MAVFNNILAGASGQTTAGDAGYQIERSLRFNSSDSAKCARTYLSGSSTTTQTFAVWVKRSKLGAARCFWSGYDGSAAYGAYFEFTSGDALQVYVGGATAHRIVTSQVFRDTSAWYHLVLNIDTNNSTSSDRIRLYVNGSRVTTFSTADYPTSGYACQFALGNANNTIGTTWGSSGYSFFDGYLADVHFIDGQALDPTSFTEVDATTGQLVPIAYSGTYGTNGFHLPFSDNSTAAALGTDTSGNGNDWTVSPNISVAAGSGNDSLVDTPTSYGDDTGAGGEVRGNYATWNPLNSYAAGLSDGNLKLTQTVSSWVQANSSIGMSSGKWYWEVTWTSGTHILNGITRSPLSASYVGSVVGSWGWSAGGSVYDGGSGFLYGDTLLAGDIIGAALDMDAGTFTMYKNGVSQGQMLSGLSGTYFAAISVYGATVEDINFGQRPFAHPVSGYKALCTQNLDDPLVAKPSEYMDVALYTGNGGTQTISGLDFSPDLVWAKSRSTARSHGLCDSVRGVDRWLGSNSTAAEDYNTGIYVTAFNSNGFSIGSSLEFNENNATYAAWTWDAGSSTVTNTDGSITSQVRANPSAGFSIVSYTGTGSAATVGHGLNTTPVLNIIKRTDAAVDWVVYTNIVDGSWDYLHLNLTNAAVNTTVFSANSSTFDFSSSAIVANISGSAAIAYCFAPVAGYSSFGSYTGNGSTDGPFVYTGFRPRWILFKCSSLSGEAWFLLDTSRSPYNISQEYLVPNTTASESSAYNIMDILSNGFKLKTLGGGSAFNGSGATYIYAAFAENPFKYARAR